MRLFSISNVIYSTIVIVDTLDDDDEVLWALAEQVSKACTIHQA